MTLSLITGETALVLTLAGAIGGGVGCVTGNMPSTTQVASSDAAIRTAQELGAERIPDASVHLELARRQLAMALRAMNERDEHAARWLLVRADADARLALALAREARAREAAEEMAARVRDLSSRTERSTEPL